MITRRSLILAAMATWLPGAAEPAARLERTNLGQGIFWLTEMLPGDACTVIGKTVRWRGHLLGFMPASIGEVAACRIARVGLDEDGCIDIRVRA